MRRDLGYREFQVRAYVEATIAVDGIAPSYGMIAKELGLAGRHAVCRIVKQLEKRGIFRRVGNGRVRRLRIGSGFS